MIDELTPLTRDQKIRLLRIARQAIFHYTTRGTQPRLDEADPRLQEKQGVFVSLHMGGRLRGCIGTFEGEGPLFQTVVDIAVGAASRDPRFSPIRMDEVPRTEVELSVLTPLEPIAAADVEAGKHGLLVSQGRARGTLLPQVATQYGWDREEFLAQVCIKAGLPREAWKDEDCRLAAFTADVFSESQMRGGG